MTKSQPAPNVFDVAIVGAGMAGVSLAWRLTQMGQSVLLIEREAQPGTQSTGRSAALFMESYGPRGIRALTRASRQFYLHPPAGFAPVDLLVHRPVLFVAMPEQLDALRAMQTELLSTGGNVQWLDAEQLEAQAPMLKPGRFAAALSDTSGYDIDVDALLQGFLRGARASGAQLRTQSFAQSASHGADGWRIRLSSGDEVSAGKLVNAAGAWADEVAAVFGAQPIGLQPKRRSAFTFKAPEGVDVSGWPMVDDVDEHWYFKPDAGQILGSPANADPVPAHDVQPEDLDIAIGIDHIQNATTLHINRPSSTWAGLRSFVPDGEIVIGYDGDCPDYFWLAGQGGYGIQSAAGASLLAATLLMGQPLGDDLTRFGVDPAEVSPRRLRR